MTDTTPVSGGFLIPGVALVIVDAFAKFKKKRSGDADHAPFGEEFLAAGVGLAVMNSLAKFKECSFIHSRNIDGI